MLEGGKMKVGDLIIIKNEYKGNVGVVLETHCYMNELSTCPCVKVFICGKIVHVYNEDLESV